MLYRFEELELDPDRLELRRRGRPVPVQPLVLSLLRYLIETRDRVVPKEELLRHVWAAPYVTDSALARAVSQARRALGDDGHELIRTHARRGYRFAAVVEVVDEPESSTTDFRPRYVRCGDVHIAYSVLGAGSGIDVVVVGGWTFPMAAIFEWPPARRFCERLAGIGRLILFDKRGTGLSDRVSNLPGLEQRIEDLDAVLEATGSQRPVLLGVSEGGPMCLLYAALRATRVRGLVLLGAFARMGRTADYPCGWAPADLDRLRNYIRHAWGGGETILALCPDRAEEPAFRRWAAEAERTGASPGAALQLLEMNEAIDVREILTAIHVPTRVFHARDDRVLSADAGRYLASRIPGARFVELPGSSHAPWDVQVDRLLALLDELPEAPEAGAEERFLATVLCLHLPEDAARGRTASLRRARERLAAAGLEVLPGGPPLLALGERPARAIELALAEIACAEHGGRERAGLATSELTRHMGRVDGAAMHLARSLAVSAPPGRVAVTRTVRDLVAGSGLRFTAHRDLPASAGIEPQITFLAEPAAP